MEAINKHNVRVPKVMNSVSYATPYFFTQPPPSYNVNSWNWSPHSSQNVRGTPDSKSSIAPPLPPGLPPPPPPPPPLSSYTPTLSRPNIKSDLEQKSQVYYNNISNSHGNYRLRSNVLNGCNGNNYSVDKSPNQHWIIPSHPNRNVCDLSATTALVSTPQIKPTNDTVLEPAFSISRYNNISSQYNRSSGHYSLPSGQYSLSGGQYSTQTGQYISSQSHYSSNSGGTYNNMTGSQNYPKNVYNKRQIDSEPETSKRSGKKKKKPLSHAVPFRKDWSVMDAKRALMVEKEYNKRHRNQSLIIKFPDLELTRDIVSKFHTAIDSVHFQQPSTPRFCFVTLKDTANPEAVMKDLNKIPFGQGHLTAEFKRDREDELNIGPEDIDPLTLYVGNLAQEVTKDEMVNTYPKQRRIDIGYAKKMKYTRYAFVSFRNVDDSIEAFQKTHATQMYSKSLIVRFRRLNGPVGMPGEPKPQFPPRNEAIDRVDGSQVTLSGDHNTSHSDVDSHNQSSDIESETCTNSTLPPWEMVDVSQWDIDTDRSIDLNSVKKKPLDDSDYEEEDVKPIRPQQYASPFLPGDLDLALSSHRPKLMFGVKKETECEEYSLPSSVEDESNDFPIVVMNKQPKPVVPAEENHGSAREKTVDETDNNTDNLTIPPEQIKKETETNNSESAYNILRSLHPRPVTSESVPMEVKKEPSFLMEEMPTETNPILENMSSSDKAGPSTFVEESLRIKDEPIDEDDETNDGDEDDSSDSDDFNFNKILSNIEARSKRLKKIK